MSGVLAMALFLAMVAVGVLAIQHFKQARARGMMGRSLPPAFARKLPPRALLFLYSPTCGVCKAQRPVLQQVREHVPVVEVDITRHLQLARDLGVFATPTYLYVEGGRIRHAWVGAQSEKAFLRVVGEVETA